MTDSRPVTASRAGTRLALSADRRGLVDQDGVPFFYLGDTAWTLFKRLDHADADRYLSNRADKGFTVIQAYVLRGLEVTNLDGELPLIDRDPTQLNEGFFRNVDWIVRRANELGLVMGLVATMGEHVKRKVSGERFKERNEQIFNEDSAYRFGELLGARYRDDCVIWLLGGDRNPSEEDIATWDAMAYGMKAGSAGVHLVSYHSGGGHSSSEYFHDKDWLDFNTVQSRHQSRDANYPLITADYALSPVKPTLDMECRYEDHPDARVIDIQKVFAGELDPDERVDAFDAREGAYWATTTSGRWRTRAGSTAPVTTRSRCCRRAMTGSCPSTRRAPSASATSADSSSCGRGTWPPLTSRSSRPARARARITSGRCGHVTAASSLYT